MASFTNLLRAMLDHLFMFRKLSLDYSEEAETELVDSLVEFLSKEKDFHSYQEMMAVFSSFYKSSPTVDHVVALFEQETFFIALPLLKHNAVLLFNKTSDTEVVVLSAIDVLPNEQSIHSNSTDQMKTPYPYDCRMAIPRSTLHVPLQQIQSTVFIEQVIELGKEYTFLAREVKARKAGHEVTETRKSAIPTYIFDWLMSSLVETDGPNRSHPVIIKKIRTESVRQDVKHKPWTRSSLWVAAKSCLHLAFVQLKNGSVGYKTTMARFQSSMVRRALAEHQKIGLFDFGEMKELAAYLSRKIEKLQQNHPEASDAMDDLCQTCESVGKVLSDEWTQFLLQEKTSNHIDMEEIRRLSFSSDTVNPFTTAKSALEAALKTNSVYEQMRSSSLPLLPPDVPSNISTSAIMAKDVPSFIPQLIQLINRCDVKKDESESILQSTEYFIRTRLWPNRQTNYSNVECLTESVYELLKAYQEKANARYAGEALRWGKMVLYSFTLVAWTDAVCIQWDPLRLVGQHRIFTADYKLLEKLLILESADLIVMEEVYEYLNERSSNSLKPGLEDISKFGLAYQYAMKDSRMISHNKEYLKEVERFSEEKLKELKTVKEKYEALRVRRGRLICDCEYNKHGYLIRCSKCSLTSEMETLETSVTPYERRLPDDETPRNVIIFHHKIPEVLKNWRESCAFLINLFAVEHDQFETVGGWVYQWNETSFNQRFAIGSRTKPFLNTHYRKQSIHSYEGSFIVPQGKRVHLVLELGGKHKFIDCGTLEFDVSKCCKLPVYHPFTGLEFAVHGVNHSENSVIALQSECPGDLGLISWKEFGSFRAGGGALQWRNVAVALEGVTLDLTDPSVVNLILQSVHQIGPIPNEKNWNADLTERQFVRELCRCVSVALSRIDHSWSSYRALHVCIAVISYVIQFAPKNLSLEPWDLLIRCRKIAVAWSDAVKLIIDKQQSANNDLLVKHWYINGLIVLTFGTFNGELQSLTTSPGGSSDDHQDAISTLLRARVLMFEQGDASTKDFELRRLHCLCYRITVRWEERVKKFLAESSEPLDQIVRERLEIEGIQWQTFSNSYYQGDCIMRDKSASIIHIHVVRGTFLVDGAPIGRLPHRIILHPLFQRTFKNPYISAFHRGGGVYESRNESYQYSFAYEEDTDEVIIRETDRKGISRRLLDPASFEDDLPHQLVEGYNYWMLLNEDESPDVELRLLNDELTVSYRIFLDSELNGQVINCQSNRTMLNFRGKALSRVCDCFLWRLDQKQFVLPWLPKPTTNEALSDQWSLCLELHRLHLHVEIWIGNKPEGTRIALREFDNMSVSASQFLYTFIGLKHMLVLERPNKLKTVIVPNLNLKTKRGSVHHKLVPVSFDLDKTLPFFAFDVDRFLNQMRPNGAETYASWLMCAYLHGATSSAMKDPLTGLTGLEMAVTQLRRCYVNKPFDPLCHKLLSKIGPLSVRRSYAHGTEVVTWDENRSGYSSSEVYSFLVYCIITKSNSLISLYGVTDVDTGMLSKLGAALKGYERYEWIYSADALLNADEKKMIGYCPSKAPKIDYSSNVKRHSNPVFKVMHAFRCRKEFDALNNVQEGKASFFPSDQKELPPPLKRSFDRHIGTWSSAASFENWLWLYLEAMECRSRPEDLERAERLAYYLSFVVYKYQTSGSSDVDLLLQVLLSDHPLTSTVQDRIERSVAHHLQSLYNNIEEIINKRRKVEEEEEKVIDYKDLHENVRQFSLRLNRVSISINPQYILDNQPIKQRCCWSCDEDFTPSIRILQPNFIERNEEDFLSSRLVIKMLVNTTINGKCKHIEAAFAECTNSTMEKDKSTSVKEIASFPFSTLLTDEKDVLNQPIGKDIITDLQSSWENYHQTKAEKGDIVLANDIREKLESCKSLVQRRVGDAWKQLITSFTPSEDDRVNRARRAAGLSSLIAQRTLFPLFGRTEQEMPQLENYLVYLVYLQKVIRCLDMLKTLDKMVEGKDKNHYAVRLICEMKEIHCSTWTPREHRKWLLFEVESNVMIRRVQADVALAIIAGDKRLLQLNMGEGKTSVISPIVMSSLANNHQVVQLTLLTSLLETHGQELCMRLGGLLEQRVYYFPCNRQIAFTASIVQKMIAEFNECLEGKGCIITVPEHRLSMLLKFEELCIRQADYYDENVIPETAQRFLELFQLQKKHLVDIIDESDEILRHKYQLLYAVGAQQSVDGGERRWLIAQALLNILRRFAPHLSMSDSLVVKAIDVTRGSASWPYIRLLNDRANHQLREKMVQFILEGNALEVAYLSTLSTKCINCISSYLLGDAELDEKNLTEEQLKDVFILRGLLSYDVFQHSLMKRWSVDYGVDTISRRRLMAVPFRGKDTPMERSDFGHPDVAIVFSHLSYYYSGLEEKQVKEAIELLKRLPQRDAEYQSWINLNTEEEIIKNEITTDSNAINLGDMMEMKKLAKFFQFNTAVINFWLNKFVFPKETRQFPFKIVASAWDLAKDQSEPVRGFSGTKDSCRLLPLGTKLSSLPQLESTDGDVLARATAKENRQVFQLLSDESVKVLDFIVALADGGSVLIDVGALMIGISNEGVAKYWLCHPQTPDRFVAAVYFEGNERMVVLRDGHKTNLNNSPLKQSLDRVLVYMDDIHTRGTDFKFSIPTVAYVTLGRELPKDKLVQAAMRMRQLGQGHSISFLAPKEIHSQLKLLASPTCEPDSSHVVQWALKNTANQLQNGMLEWATQGLIFSRRVAAVDVITSPKVDETGRLSSFSTLIKVPELTQLSEMYGDLQCSASAVKVVTSTQTRLIQSLATMAGEASSLMDPIAQGIIERCKQYIPDLIVNSKCLDEEQERELEEEKEEEKEIHRPAAEKPFTPTEPTGLKEWIRNIREEIEFSENLLPLWQSMEYTTTYDLIPNGTGFDSRIFVTSNYQRTIEAAIQIQDEFIRSPRWALVFWEGTPGSSKDDVEMVVLLDPFEADIAIRELRLPSAKRCSLHRFAPRNRKDQSELLTSGLTTWSDVAMSQKTLDFAVMGLSVFGTSTCFTKYIPDGHSVDKLCRFLGLLLPPSNEEDTEITSDDWKVLINGDWIESDGFVGGNKPIPPDSRVSSSCLRILKNMSSSIRWKKSPIQAIFELVPLRNMTPWYEKSDLHKILRK